MLKNHKSECADQSDVLDQKHMCMYHMQQVLLGFSAATVWREDLSSVFTHSGSADVRSRSAENAFVRQEHEPAAGPG